MQNTKVIKLNKNWIGNKSFSLIIKPKRLDYLIMRLYMWGFILNVYIVAVESNHSFSILNPVKYLLIAS